MKKINTLRATVLAAVLATGSAAWATNGMLMEGYGPESLAQGGASTAYYNGTAGMMNNPATLQLGVVGSRLDVAMGILGPNVKSSVQGMPVASSSGTSYVMPALGWVRKSDQMTWGVGIFGQGGMGTEYGADSFLAMGSGSGVRSELGAGRVIFPLSFKVNEQLSVGGSLDYTWSGLDMKMAASGQQLGGMVTGMPSGNLGSALPQLAAASWARIDFSNNSDFSGAATSTGWTGKLGAVYQASPNLSLGITHHLKTNVGDMKTNSTGASMSAAGGFMDQGQIIVRDFQMPSSTALGLAFKANSALTLVADIKRIRWHDVMKSFNMTYISAGMGGQVDFSMPQNWKDQTVVSLGGSYKTSEVLVLRAGFNQSSNPIPDNYVNPLFPAIVKKHFTAGMSYRITDKLGLDAAVSHAPNVSVTSGSGVSISHAQTNYQFLMNYSY
ncbi:OmpP1/FadL family transporter [Limnohabitans sp. Rim47]|uniref:OmpP1/FadL family transporter n=1 Tax=Limnohabitans sp. Rim47 TaxID=1100721 RepID=UPI0002F3E5B7|nr:outer membrane protein transport protein [Limnohabitans sp. Rim47]